MTSRTKKVLVVQYSQTGQLSRIVSSISNPLIDSDAVEVTTVTIEPVQAYPFPWDFFSFFDVFPESVYLDSPAIKDIDIGADDDFDLIILAYQVWFLSPSLPVTAFLKSETGHKLLKGKPVITVIGCRNMWAMAQQTMKTLLHEVGARLIDNIALVDQGSALASFVTTPRWLFTGNKDAFSGFPAAGVSEQDIRQAGRFGFAIIKGLASDQEKTGQPLLYGLQAVKADSGLIQSEKVGYRSFRIWGKLLRKVGKPGTAARKPVLVIYLIFLILMIVTVVPVNMLLKRILAPLLKKKQAQVQMQYELPSGSGIDRMDEFECQ